MFALCVFVNLIANWHQIVGNGLFNSSNFFNDEFTSAYKS
jgi:hypothetical protein